MLSIYDNQNWLHPLDWIWDYGEENGSGEHHLYDGLSEGQSTRYRCLYLLLSLNVYGLRVQSNPNVLRRV